MHGRHGTSTCNNRSVSRAGQRRTSLPRDRDARRTARRSDVAHAGIVRHDQPCAVDERR
jgi:hypothetical protein